MSRVYAGVRALALVVAILGAFVTVPYIATVLLVLGAISALGNSNEDNLRVYAVTVVLLIGAKELAVVPAVGTYLATMFGGIGMAALGASALGVLMALYRLTMAAFAPKPA
jgi:hypothetical protein